MHLNLSCVFRAIKEFASSSVLNELPRPGNVTDAEMVFQIAQDINMRCRLEGLFNVENLQDYKSVIIRLALCSRGMISPMCSLMGGVVAQEVLKAASGNYLFLYSQTLHVNLGFVRKIYANKAVDVL